jgi:benzylsuccinate CoA-transferase BbsF subunit
VCSSDLSWTVDYTPEEIATLLQDNSITAGIVQSGKDALEDPQLRHRGFWVTLNHPEFGEYRAELPPWKLSKTPAQIRMHVPMIGEHNEFVCTQLIGMSDEEFIGYLSEGALS